MKIKLLIYSHDWLPVLGGIQSVTLSLASGLVERSRGHDSGSFEIVFVTQTRGNGTDDLKLPFRVVRQPGLAQLIRLIRWADVVDLAGPAILPMALSWILRKPTALEHHGYQSICPNGMLVYEPDRRICPGYFMAGRYLKCVECNKKEMGLTKSIRNLALTFPRRWLAKRVTKNVGVSPHVAKRVALPRTITIWNGVAAISEPLKQGELGCGDLPVCFGYLGRLVTEKGLSVLLRASHDLVAQGYAFRLRIVGDGPERKNLEKLAQEYGLFDRTEFLGFVPTTAIPEALRGVSVIVMPSICEDVSPLAVMEQMMEGRLLIGSDIGGLGLVIGDAGLKFPVGDAKALASCMLQALNDPSRTASLGETGRKRALQMFTRDRMVEEHERLYEELGQRKSPSA